MQINNITGEGQRNTFSPRFYVDKFELSGGIFFVMVIGMVTRFLVSLRQNVKEFHGVCHLGAYDSLFPMVSNNVYVILLIFSYITSPITTSKKVIG